MTFAWHHPNYYKKLKREATSSKRQAYNFCKGDEEEPQASSSKPQASSAKHKASSSKPQASKHQASSSKPKRSGQKIPEPRSTNQQ
jgi:hypothetical protein